MLSGDIPPNQTIYIKNLNEKLNKDELKRSVYCLFSQFGRILDVVALKTPNLRGQAWVCFSEITAASNAVRQMNNFPFYDKPIRIQYAKTKSDCLAKADGSFHPKDKDKDLNKDRPADRNQHTPNANSNANANANGNANPNATQTTSAQQRKPGGRETTVAPNNILFVQNLPYNATSMMVRMLFEQYPGFREVRMIDAKPGIAFVEFEAEEQSAVAMQALQEFKITPQNPMEITYAKK